MKRKFIRMFPFFSSILVLSILPACGPAVLPATETPAAPPTFTASLIAQPTDTAVCDGLCPSDSLTATAAMGATLDVIPTNTPPPWATIIPSAGDLGWGSVHGQVVDGVTGLPLEGATVTCEHVSSTSPYLCKGSTATNGEGAYIFTEVFFHNTDRITLLVEAPGYVPLRFEQASFSRPDFEANLGLFPVTDEAPTHFPMCTPPACSDGVLVCGEPDGCPGGCGTICLRATPTP